MAPPKLQDLEFHERLGRGASGSVYRATRRKDGKQLAVKELDMSGLDTEEKEDYVHKMLIEVQALGKISSPFVIKYYGSFLYDDRLFIVTEYAGNGDLHQLLRQRSEPLDEPTVWKFILQACTGLQHIHSQRILHRDIKTPNIFLDQDNNIKIGDMGISKVLGTMTKCANSLVGTPYYLSPELCEGLPYDEKADMWALGIVLYELCTGGRKPFEGDSLAQLVIQITEGSYPQIDGYSRHLMDILDGLLAYSADDRLGTHEVLGSSVVQMKAAELGINLGMARMSVSLESDHLPMTAMEPQEGVGVFVVEPGFQQDVELCNNAALPKGPPKIMARGAHKRDAAATTAASRAAVNSGGEAASRQQGTDGFRSSPLAPATSDKAPTASSMTPPPESPSAVASVGGGGDGGRAGANPPRVGWQADQRPHSPAAGEMHAAQGKSGKAFQTLEDAPLPDTGPLPEPSTSRALAVHYAQHATAEDDAGRFESAFRLYKEALSHFEAAIKKSDPGKVREVLTKKMVAYLERAEYLKQVLTTRNLYRAASARRAKR